MAQQLDIVLYFHQKIHFYHVMPTVQMDPITFNHLHLDIIWSYRIKLYSLRS